MKNLKKIIVQTASYYGKNLDADILELYVQDLKDLPEDKCIQAYHAYRRLPDSKTFPLPAQIRKIVNPENSLSAQELAAEIASRITGAVVKFGYANPQDAKAFVGDVGWSVVERRGGWSYICQNLGTLLNPSTFEAQVREQVKSSILLGDKANIENFNELGLKIKEINNTEAKSVAIDTKKNNALEKLQGLIETSIKKN